jgi:hypothetical protein
MIMLRTNLAINFTHSCWRIQTSNSTQGKALGTRHFQNSGSPSALASKQWALIIWEWLLHLGLTRYLPLKGLGFRVLDAFYSIYIYYTYVEIFRNKKDICQTRNSGLN